MTVLKFFLTAAFFHLGILSPTVLNAAPRDIPVLSGPVIDEPNLLSAQETRDISAALENIRGKVQIQVWIVRSLDGEAIESLSIRATDKWKLGTAKEDNGVLILISTEDRQMRIEVGQGLEGV